MALVRFLILTSLCIAGQEALSVSACRAYNRQPQYSDITVMCDSSSIDLAIQICPVIYMGYNESLLILNHIQNVDCQGTLDTSVAPPVVRFSFPLRQRNACGSTFSTSNTPGVGIISDFSNLQIVNISGVVHSFDPAMGMVTSSAQLKYYYSCVYPLEYLIKNTQVNVSSSYLALDNGSFLSTLSMALYQDKNFTIPLVIPPLGIELRRNIYVQVFASNLILQYFVLLDRCYVSLSPLPSNSTSFNLFTLCSIDQMITVLENGVSQKVRFYFPAFRFTKQQNETVSTYYLHCITRLCEPSTCSVFKQCNRKKRREETTVKQKGVTKPSELIVPIRTKKENAILPKDGALSGGHTDDKGASVGLGIAVAVLIVIGAAAMLMTASFYQKLK